MFRITCAFTLLLMWNLPLAAHHGWFDVDWSKRVTVTGAVRHVCMVGPHASIDVEIKGEVWKVDLVAPLGLMKLGIPHDNLEPGKIVTLTLVPYSERANEFRAEQVTAGDKTASLLPPGTKPPVSPGAAPQFPPPPPGAKPPQ